jgi:hypothetical protein
VLVLVPEDVEDEVCELVFEPVLVPDVVVDDEDVLDAKSFASYRIETPYPFTASVFVCRVASRTVNADPSVTVVVISLVNIEAQAWPGKLNAVGV